MRRTPMFAEFATAVSADALPLARVAAEPSVRLRRLTAAAGTVASTAAAAVTVSQEIVMEIQAIAAVVLGSTVAAKASFSEAGLDSLGELWPQSCLKRSKTGMRSGPMSAFASPDRTRPPTTLLTRLQRS